jgi:FkbM family methyltransferase
MRRLLPSTEFRQPASPVPAPVAEVLRDAPLRAIDVGAARGVPLHWRRFLPHLRVEAFEPNAAECARLTAKSHPHISWYPTALAAETGPRDLHVLATPTGSSFFPPAPAFVELFGLPGYSEVDHVERLDCVSLGQHLGDRPAPHLLKLDTQGSELEILSGLRVDQLAEVLAIEIEIEFHEAYQGQPLFPEVHQFMQEAGLALLDFRVQRAHLTGGIEERHFLRQHLSMATGGRELTAQLHAVDALYIRPMKTMATSTGLEQFFRYATVLQMYRYYDGIFWLLAQPAIERLVGDRKATLVRAYERAAPRPTFLQRSGVVPQWLRRARRGSSHVVETMLGREGFDPPRVAWSRAYWPDC